MWMGVFAPTAADTAIETLENLIIEMANDKLPPWFVQAMQGAWLLGIVKEESRNGYTGDHKHVVIPNTLSKVAYKAMLAEC